MQDKPQAAQAAGPTQTQLPCHLNAEARQLPSPPACSCPVPCLLWSILSFPCTAAARRQHEHTAAFWGAGSSCGIPQTPGTHQHPRYQPTCLQKGKELQKGKREKLKETPPTHPDNRAARAFPESAPVKPEDFQTKKSDYFCPDHHHHLPATPHSHRQAAHNSRQPAPENRQADTVHKHTHRAELT